jgi:diguanylate cyclase (GGDEF)-like protein
MTHVDDSGRLDLALARYRNALEAEDLDAQEALWRQAESDPDLEAWLLEFNADELLAQTGALAPPTAEEHGGAARDRLERIAGDLDALPSPAPEEVVEALYSEYRCSVLVVDDEPTIRGLLRQALGAKYDVLEAQSPELAKAVFRQRPVDVLLADLCLKGAYRGDLSGVELMEWAREHSPRTVCLMMSVYGELEAVAEAVNRGHILHYLPKVPWPGGRPFLNVVEEAVGEAARAFTLERKNHDLRERLKDLNRELEEKVRERTRDLIEALHELDRKNKALEKLALTDVLTGLPNRRAMSQLLERELHWRQRYPGPLTLGLIDIDHFKGVNTAHHWSGGDRVLVEVCRCLSGGLRDVDYLGRQGGDELMLIAPQADLAGARTLAERLRQRVESTPVVYKGETIRVTVSLGLAVAETGAPTDLDRLREASEAALASAKEQGRNRCVVTVVPAGEVPQARRARG